MGLFLQIRFRKARIQPRLFQVCQFRDRAVDVEAGEFIIVPHGVEHQPYATEECEVLLLEPKTTLNTGTEVNERTVATLERLV